MRRSSDVARLAGFLADTFGADELQRFVHEWLPGLALELPEGASRRACAEALVERLRRRNAIDERLFAALREERPGRADEIEALELAFRGDEAAHAASAKFIEQRLADVERRRSNLREAGLSTTELDRERLELRRLQRTRPPEPGEKLGGRFVLDAMLGRGGFASVWRARDLKQNRWVALKVLSGDCARDDDLRARFFRGARTMQRFDHPGIVRVYEAELVIGELAFVALELVSGGDLRQAVLQRRVAPADIGPILVAVCEALAELHADGVVHRDIKPSNILLSDSGTPRLTDFDLVRVDDTTGGTRTGALGTVLYSAPETWNQAHAATPAADVYSLAMCALFAWSGAELTPDVLRDCPGFLYRLDPPPALARVLLRALSWEVTARHADAGALLDDLRRALEQDATPAVATDPAHDVLYWIADERGTAETLWLSERGGQARVVARAPGLLLAAGTRLWRLERSSFEIPSFTWAGEDTWRFDPLAVDSARLVELTGDAAISLDIVDRASLTQRMPEGAELSPGALVHEDFPNGPEDVSHAVLPIAGLGALLLVRSEVYQCWAGAAHGSFDVAFHALDLSTGAPVGLFTAEETRRVVEELAPRARREIAGKLQTGSGDELESESLELTMAFPRYDRDGRLSLQVQLTAGACYADSDREWCDYTSSVRLDAAGLPVSLVPYAVAPALLQAYWRTSPRFAGSFGWSFAARTPEMRRLLHATFAAGDP
ncbi:protein kinase [Nannocystis sp. SCPEA4]|nr:protein kinase [Nannocystis sp. SCPEA4]